MHHTQQQKQHHILLMWLLSSRAAFWLLLSVILVLNVPALSAPQARYIPPQAQVATPAAAAVKSESYKDGPYVTGSRRKGQPDTEETASYDTAGHDGSSKKQRLFQDSSPPKYSGGSQEPAPHSTLVRTPQYTEDDSPRYPNKRPAYDNSRDDSRQYRPGSSRQYADAAPAPDDAPSSPYTDLETDDSSRQYDEPEGRQYSRRRAYRKYQKTEDRDPPDYHYQRPKYSDPGSYPSQDRADSQEQLYHSSSPQGKDHYFSDKQSSYSQQPDRYQEKPDPYSGTGPDEEHRGPAPYYDEQSGEEEEEQIVEICLQRTSPQQFPGGVQPYEETFRCCEAADIADTCSKNGTDPSYPYTRKRNAPYGEQQQDSFMDLVSSSPAATCRWAITDKTSCPFFAFGLGSTCVAVQLNCTLSSAASECGCPIKEGSLYFSTVTYVRPLESLTCLRQPVDSNPRPYWATGAFLQGKLRSVATRQGGRSLVWKECGGSVEYSPQLPFSSTIPRAANADEYTEDDFWLRSGQMVVRLAEGHFAGRGAE